MFSNPTFHRISDANNCASTVHSPAPSMNILMFYIYFYLLLIIFFQTCLVLYLSILCCCYFVFFFHKLFALCSYSSCTGLVKNMSFCQYTFFHWSGSETANYVVAAFFRWTYNINIFVSPSHNSHIFWFLSFQNHSVWACDAHLSTTEQHV